MALEILGHVGLPKILRINPIRTVTRTQAISVVMMGDTHNNNSNNSGCTDHAVRKKFKLDSKVLNVTAAADASKGPRDSMEDTHTIRDDLKFYGVYDGHGGEKAATILQETKIVESELYINGKIEEAINHAFVSVDNHILQESQANKWDCGTTAVVALIQGTKLYIANCGDSEAVLGRRKLQRKSSKMRSRRNTESATSTPIIADSPASQPPPPRSLTVAVPNDSSLTDSLGVSPTSVLSHLSLTSPRNSPRFHSRTSSLCSEGPFDNSAPSTPTNIPLPPIHHPPSPALTLSNTIPRTAEKQNGHPNQSTQSTQPVNSTESQITQATLEITQITQTNNTDSAVNNHKRTHSPKEEDEDNEQDGDDDDEWEEWEEDPGDTLTADIEAYLKENPTSFFCHKEGQCGMYEPLVVSCSHRPTCEDEVKRIDAAGGSVSYGRVLGELGVTRAFGDIHYKHPHNKAKDDFVSVKPHIKIIDLQPHDEFLILASDGLWDVVSHKEAVDVISKARSAQDSQQSCEDLVDEALRKNSFDNVTVLFLSFKWSAAAN